MIEQFTNKEYELNLIGAILFDNSVLELLKVESKHLYFKDTRIALESILALKKNDEVIDYANLYEKIKDDTKFTLSELIGITENGEMLLSAIDGIQKNIIKAYEKRLTKELLQNGLENLGKEDAEKILSDIQKKLESNIKTDIKIYNISDCVEDALVITENAYKKGGEITGMKTGYKVLDSILNGIERKKYIIVGARPSVGKTAFSLELANRLGINNKVLFFSLEMGREELGQRLLANQSGFSLSNIKKGNLKAESFCELSNASNKLYKRNIKIVDDEGTTIEDIRRISTIEKNKNGLDIVIVDYLTLCDSCLKFNTDREKFNYISNELRKLSKKLDVAVICLAQLNRAVESRANKTPLMSDLKETGNIEQDANIILFLSEPEEEEQEFKENFVNVLIAKNRSGQKDKIINFRFYKQIQALEEQ